MDVIKLKKKNEVFLEVEAERAIIQELSEFFTFYVPGYKFMPAFRNKMWDGKIRLLNLRNNTIYSGVVDYIDRFAKDREYLLEYDYEFGDEEFSLKEAEDFVKKLGPKMTPRDYQMKAFVHAVRKNRSLLLSPTASGKSFIIYLLTRYYGRQTLIVVPTTTLVHQMASDFEEYGLPQEKFIHKIQGGVEKDTGKPIVISTWQSIYKQPKSWFDRFEVVIGDEAHLFKAKSLTDIMTKMTDTQYRFGFTGTLDGTQCHRLMLEGLFGSVYKVTTTSELIEKKQLSDFKIKCIVLQYDDDTKKMLKAATYQDEMDFIVRNEKRNRFLKNLVHSLDGNTLLLFQYVEKHGKILYDMIKDGEKENVFFVHGGIEGEERDEIRHIVEQQNDAVIIASYGTFSTGINIKNLHNIIFASPSKSRIRNLQSIGRGLRLGENKESATLYDVADDLIWKNKKNHTILHFAERVKIYNEEKFEYKIYNVKLR